MIVFGPIRLFAALSDPWEFFFIFFISGFFSFTFFSLETPKTSCNRRETYEKRVIRTKSAAESLDCTEILADSHIVFVQESTPSEAFFFVIFSREFNYFYSLNTRNIHIFIFNLRTIATESIHDRPHAFYALRSINCIHPVKQCRLNSNLTSRYLAVPGVILQFFFSVVPDLR